MDGWVAASKHWNKAIQTHYTNLSACLSADYTEWLAHCTPSDKVRRGGRATQPSREKTGAKEEEKKGCVERQQIITWLPKRLRCALQHPSILYLFPPTVSMATANGTLDTVNVKGVWNRSVRPRAALRHHSVLCGKIPKFKTGETQKGRKKSHDISSLHPTDPHQLYVILQRTRLFMGSVVWNKYGHIEWRGAH